MKDMVLYPENVAKYGVLNFVFGKGPLPSASGAFRAVGYGHGAAAWKAIIQAYMDVDYDGILSIENEDPQFLREKSAWRAAYVLRNVRNGIVGS